MRTLARAFCCSRVCSGKMALFSILRVREDRARRAENTIARIVPYAARIMHIFTYVRVCTYIYDVLRARTYMGSIHNPPLYTPFRAMRLTASTCVLLPPCVFLAPETRLPLGSLCLAHRHEREIRTGIPPHSSHFINGFWLEVERGEGRRCNRGRESGR